MQIGDTSCGILLTAPWSLVPFVGARVNYLHNVASEAGIDLLSVQLLGFPHDCLDCKFGEEGEGAQSEQHREQSGKLCLLLITDRHSTL